jgi:hypothetical protein
VDGWGFDNFFDINIFISITIFEFIVKFILIFQSIVVIFVCRGFIFNLRVFSGVFNGGIWTIGSLGLRRIES